MKNNIIDQSNWGSYSLTIRLQANTKRFKNLDNCIVSLYYSYKSSFFKYIYIRNKYIFK